MSGIVYRRSDGAAWRGVARVSATGALLSFAVRAPLGPGLARAQDWTAPQEASYDPRCLSEPLLIDW